MNRNLEPGQYQIGDFVFGEGTLFPVEQFDIGAYDVNVQDFQVPNSDELRFGSDSLKPMPIQITINALKNYLLPNMVGLTGDIKELNFEGDPRPGGFAKEWRADSVRARWGELKPLLICREDGEVVRVYGRPGKLSIPPLSKKLRGRGQVQKIVAEFRRSDTLAYSDFEWFVHTRPLEQVTIVRSERMGMGDAPSWLRFLLVGPMTHPIIQLGSITIEIDVDIEVGEIVEISSYPWARRAIRLNDGLSLNAQIISPYLDRLNFESNSPIQLSWTATDVNTQVENVDFSGYSNGSLPSSWWVDYNNANAGTIVVNNGLVTWSPSGNQSRLGTAVYKTPTLTPWQLVGVTVAAPGMDWFSSEPRTRIIGRSNDTRTDYQYWDVTRTYCWFGVHSNGTDTILSERFRINTRLEMIIEIIRGFFTNPFGLSWPGSNWSYEVEFSPDSSVLRINGHLVARFLIPPSVSPLTKNLYSGFGMYASPMLSTQAEPGTISEFHVRDNAPADVMAGLDVSAVLMLWRDAWQTI